VILATCAHECEVFFGRLVVPTSTPRTITTTADILERPFEPVALMSRFPDVSGVTLTNSTVRRWNRTAGAFEAAAGYLMPGGRWAFEAFEAGTFELRVDAAPAAAMPREFVTGVSEAVRHADGAPARRHRRGGRDGEPVGWNHALRRR